MEQILEDRAFRLLEKPIYCCGTQCVCEGFDGQNLRYRCPCCQTEIADALDIAPLFAMDGLEAMLVQHYEITCPYCQGRAPLVGGNSQKGLYFVCENRCHTQYARYIRRF